MDGKTAIAVETCPACGSLDVRATEPHWFYVGFERRGDLDEGWVERLELGCRDCGLAWS